MIYDICIWHNNRRGVRVNVRKIRALVLHQDLHIRMIPSRRIYIYTYTYILYIILLLYIIVAIFIFWLFFELLAGRDGPEQVLQKSHVCVQIDDIEPGVRQFKKRLVQLREWMKKEWG